MSKKNNIDKNPKLLPSISQLPDPNLSQNTLPPIRSIKPSIVYGYECKICQKVFNRKNSLVRHERIHTGLRPYSCTICNKNFARKDILEGHKLSIKCQRSTQYYLDFTASQLSSQPRGSRSIPSTLGESRRTSIESLISNNEPLGPEAYEEHWEQLQLKSFKGEKWHDSFN